MRLIITRPQERALPLAEKLKSFGHETMLAPMLKFGPVRFEVPSELLQGVVFTSVQGVEAVANLDSIKMFPVYAVGSKTAIMAREAGFGTVYSADGDVENLLALILEKCNPAKGVLLHLSGAQAAGNLAIRLRDKGFDARRVTAYQAHAADAFPASIVEKMRAGAFDGVLFFSPRTVRIFNALVAENKLQDSLRKARAFCISPNIAAELGKYQWGKIMITSAPNEEAMIDLLRNAMK